VSLKTDGTKPSDTSGCRLCGKPVVHESLCHFHHKERKYEEWLDNTNPDNLGIVKWAKELLPEFAFNETPSFHKELYLSLLMLYDPQLRNKYERLRAFISFRGSAKSTAANTIFVAYVLANNRKNIKVKRDDKVESFHINESTIIIISQTATSAEDFSVRIRDAFSENERLRYYYRVEIVQAIDSTSGQWTRSAFKINQCYLQAIGSGQTIRGKVKGASRPTLVIADDIYSESNVITDTRREQTRSWWNNAVMNSVDDLRGKVLMLGTILHEDTVLVDTKRNPRWHTIEIPVMPINLFHKFVEKHLVVNWETGTCMLPYDDKENLDERARLQRRYFDKIQLVEDWKLSWPARIDLYMLAIKYQESVFNNTVSGLYQEYFHITLSPHERRFKKEYFQVLGPFEHKFEFGYNWIRHSGEDEFKIINIEFGIDIAGTGKDEAAITVVGSTPDMRLHILMQAVGKWSIRDNLDDIDRINRVQMDRSVLTGVGIVDETFRMARKWHPSKVKIGAAGEEELIINEFRRVFQENRDYHTQILKRPQVGGKMAERKEDRIRNTMLPYYETRMVYHNSQLAKLEHQLEYLGRTTHDDCADAAECAFWRIDFPEPLSYSYFEIKADTALKPVRIPPKQSYYREHWRTL